MTEFEKMNNTQRNDVIDGVIAGDVACGLTAANHLMAQQADEFMSIRDAAYDKVNNAPA